MEDISRFLRHHVPWSEMPPSSLDQVVRGIEILYLPRQASLGSRFGPGDGGLILLRSGSIRFPSDGLPRSLEVLGEGDFLVLDGRPELPSLDEIVAEEDSLLYHLPAEALAPLEDHRAIRYWVRSSPTRRLAAMIARDLPPKPEPRNELCPDHDRGASHGASPWSPNPATADLLRVLAAIEEVGRSSDGNLFPRLPLAHGSLHPPSAALVHLWERLPEIATPDALAAWTEAAAATLAGRRPGNLDEASRAFLWSRMADARLRKAADLVGRDLLPRCPWAMLTTAPTDRCTWIPGMPLMLVARDASDQDRRRSEAFLERLDGVLTSSGLSSSPPLPDRSIAGRCLDEGAAAIVSSGSQDLAIEWIDARPVDGPLDPRDFQRHLGMALRTPEVLRRSLSHLRVLLPTGLVHGMVSWSNGRLEEAIRLEDHLFLPLRELARITAVACGEAPALSTPARWAEGARRAVVPEDMAQAAMGAWIWALGQEVRLEDPSENPWNRPASRTLRPTDLSPRDRCLLRDVLVTMHRLADWLGRGPWSEGTWRY